MSSPARRWWPISTADLSRLSAAVTTVVDAWHARWVVQPEPLAAQFDIASGTSPIKRWRDDAGVDLRLVERSFNRLLRKALDLPTGMALPLGGHAADIVGKLSSAMFDDLIAGIGHGLSLNDLHEGPSATDDADTARHALTISLADGEPLLHVAVTAQWIRDSLPPTTGRPLLPTTSRQAALADSRVVLTAIAGSCDLSAAELAGLAIGDVLVTTTPLDRPMSLALTPSIDGARTPVAQATPIRRNGRLVMAVTSVDPIR